MLEELYVDNIGGISSSQLKFEGNFIVITGESGAGKSSLVRAVELLSGKRAQTSFIRYGEEKSNLKATLRSDFFPDKPRNIEPENDRIIIKREIFRNGRSKCYLQDKISSLSMLSDFMSNQVHIQSQFAQLDLLDTQRQMKLVESCGGEGLKNSSLRVKQFFRKAYDLDRKAREIRSGQRDLLRKFDNASQILDIIKKVNPRNDSETEWQKEIDTLKLEIKRKKRDHQVLMTFKGTEAEPGLVDRVEENFPSLAELVPNKDRSRAKELADSCIEKMFELMGLAETCSSSLSLSEMEQNLEETEQKMGFIRKAKRLALVDTVGELLEYAKEAKEGMEWISSSNEELSCVEEQCREYRVLASEEAMKLRKHRKDAAEELEAKVNWAMRDLAMLGMHFEIQLNELDKLRENGADEVSFLLRTTEGFSGPVMKVASGGELSRLLLSIQISLPEDQFPETLVFDEVEAGLGGRAAVLAGYKLKELSSRCQVILITHEASIASLADQHFVVNREGEFTRVSGLNYEDRISEIARMLSGDYSLEVAREHAKKLLSENSLSPAGKN